ncbi:MAG TPA: hypothetical protein VHK67_05175 [Rhabdochlamydiaceae bacterium]|jgi:hypothetical protein|nr:hypothetical protein [Rhabdochlamydiaceae bacterium]
MLKTLFVFLTSLCFVFGGEIDLSSYETSLYSQNGEDGILSKLFQLIEPTTRYCVEFGADEGFTNSNTYLLRKQEWNCLLLDRMHENPNINLHKEFITAENITALFDKYNVPHDLDLLSIDIDYNDFYIWKALDEKFKPAVVLIEYNAAHLPLEDKVVKYLPYFCGDGTNYFGASILALYNLGRSKGYSLVYAEKAGTNLFFIRDDILEEKKLRFKDMNDVEKLYRFPTYGKGPNGGHRKDPNNRAYLTSSDLLE